MIEFFSVKLFRRCLRRHRLFNFLIKLEISPPHWFIVPLDKKYLKDDYDVFLVANDKYNMYPTIAAKAGIQIIPKYKRPALNRTEKDKSAYTEIIFYLKGK